MKAIVMTRDPEVVEAALRRLPEAQPETVITFDGDSWSWPRRD